VGSEGDVFMGTFGPVSDEDETPRDGVDRCRWLRCYRGSNGAGELFCERHESARGAELLRQALYAAEDLGLG
jgi:hypothetical protein